MDEDGRAKTKLVLDKDAAGDLRSTQTPVSTVLTSNGEVADPSCLLRHCSVDGTVTVTLEAPSTPDPSDVTGNATPPRQDVPPPNFSGMSDGETSHTSEDASVAADGGA